MEINKIAVKKIQTYQNKLAEKSQIPITDTHENLLPEQEYLKDCGGDYHFIARVYGHSWIARQNVTRLLSEKIAEGFYMEKSF